MYVQGGTILEAMHKFPDGLTSTLRKLTRSFAFVDGEAFEGDKLLVTASAIFRVFDS